MPTKAQKPAANGGGSGGFGPRGLALCMTDPNRSLSPGGRVLSVPKEPATASANGAEADDDRSEFDRFKDLTRRLLTVPKRELDALRNRESNGA